MVQLVFVLSVSSRAATFNDFGSWQSAAGPFLTVNFEDLPDGTVVTDQYKSMAPIGILFQAGDTDFLEIENAAGVTTEVGGVPVSGTQVLDTEPSDVAPIIVRFVVSGTSTPTSVPAAGLWFIDLATFGGAKADFYNSGGVLIDTVTFTPAVESNAFFGAVNNLGIARMEIDGVNSGEFTLIDDVVVVPEPMLTAAVMGGIFAAGRRRRGR
jgi:hypothetical protein